MKVLKVKNDTHHRTTGLQVVTYHHYMVKQHQYLHNFLEIFHTVMYVQ